jgi:hypothetical protein
MPSRHSTVRGSAGVGPWAVMIDEFVPALPRWVLCRIGISTAPYHLCI